MDTKAPWLVKKKPPQTQLQQQYDPDMPSKRINLFSQINEWEETKAYDIYLNFLVTVNSHVRGLDNRYGYEKKGSKVICGLVSVLDKISSLVEQTDCVEKKSLQRFGNPAYRIFFDKLKRESIKYLKMLFHELEYNVSGPESSKLKEVWMYLTEGFGNRTRIDYGSGHEASFLFFLACFEQLELIKTKEDYIFLCIRVFNKYLGVVRKIQMKYNLEPAGSHGCWGLDDFQFIPFMWGSSQLLEHEVIFPKDILDENLHDKYLGKYLYMDAIKYINTVKKGPFNEHSSILYSLTTCKTWKKINGGMIKMYKAEVLAKFVVVQHFLFGKLLPYKKK